MPRIARQLKVEAEAVLLQGVTTPAIAKALAGRDKVGSLS